MTSSVEKLCEDVMSNWKIPLSDRVRLCREIRAKAKRNSSAHAIVKELAGMYMGSRWAKSHGANSAIGAYLGLMLSRK